MLPPQQQSEGLAGLSRGAVGVHADVASAPRFPQLRRLPALIIVLYLLLYIGLATSMPYGSYDAFVFWNQKARWLAYTGDFAFTFKTLPLEHQEYPPLLPIVSTVALRLFGDSTTVLIAVHGMFLMIGLLLLAQGRVWVLAVVGLILLNYAAWQYADVPLAVALLGGTVAFFTRRAGWVGVALGIGLLLKNEGLLIALIFMSVWSVALWLRERRLPMRALVTILPFMVAFGTWKLWIGDANDVVGASGLWERLTDWGRYQLIAGFILTSMISFSTSALLFIGIGLWLDRIRLRWSVPLVAVMLIWGGYFMIYVITPHDIVFHFINSYERLLLHLVPSWVVALTWQRQPPAVPSA